MTPPSIYRGIDLSSRNVFGQPRLRASLRDLRSPRKAHKSTIEDDLKKLIIMDSTSLEQEDELVRPPQPPSSPWKGDLLEGGIFRTCGVNVSEGFAPAFPHQSSGSE